MGSTQNSGRYVACYKCRYYQVTWDVRQPYGCQAHGFKTNRNPSLIVYESSGIKCQLFEPKLQNPGVRNQKPE